MLPRTPAPARALHLRAPWRDRGNHNKSINSAHFAERNRRGQAARAAEALRQTRIGRLVRPMARAWRGGGDEHGIRPEVDGALSERFCLWDQADRGRVQLGLGFDGCEPLATCVDRAAQSACASSPTTRRTARCDHRAWRDAAGLCADAGDAGTITAQRGSAALWRRKPARGLGRRCDPDRMASRSIAPAPARTRWRSAVCDCRRCARSTFRISRSTRCELC